LRSCVNVAFKLLSELQYTD